MLKLQEMTSDTEGSYVEQEFDAADLRKLDEVIGSEEEDRPTFEKLLEHFITEDVKHSPECPLCEKESEREPGSKCKVGCERWKINQWKDSAVAQWVAQNGCVLIPKNMANQQVRMLSCSTYPEVIAKHETARSRWKNTIKKLCKRLGMGYMRQKRRPRNRPEEALRTSSSSRGSLAREPVKIHCVDEEPLQGPVTKTELGEDDSLPWKLIVGRNKHVCGIKQAGRGMRGKAIKVA